MSIDSLSNGCQAFLVDRAMVNNISEHQAALLLTFWGIFARISVWFVLLPVINKTPRRKQITLAITTCCWSLITLISVYFTSFYSFVIYCSLAGLFFGIDDVLWYLVLADTMDVKLVVPAYSLQCLIAGPFVMFSVPTAGMIYDHTQSYDVPYIIFSCLGLFGGFCDGLLVYFEWGKESFLIFKGRFCHYICTISEIHHMHISHQSSKVAKQT